MSALDLAALSSLGSPGQAGDKTGTALQRLNAILAPAPDGTKNTPSAQQPTTAPASGTWAQVLAAAPGDLMIVSSSWITSYNNGNSAPTVQWVEWGVGAAGAEVPIFRYQFAQQGFSSTWQLNFEPLGVVVRSGERLAIRSNLYASNYSTRYVIL